MLPWGHAAVGYLVYSGRTHLRNRLPFDGWAVIALGFGTQFPDLVDKPLAWSFAVLPSGRSLAHSAITLALVGAVVLTVARRKNRERVGWAFIGGYASHILADAIAPLSEGHFNDLRYVLYPVVSVPTPDTDYSFIEFFLNLTLTPLISLGLVLTGLALVQWYRDGLPGLAELLSVPKRVLGGDSR